MTRSDASLVKAFGRRRDETSFRELYRRHTPMLFGLAMRLCGTRAEAEELTQEAWVRAVENHDRYDGRSKYGSWVAGILVNCFRESARRSARSPTSLDEQPHLEGGAVIAAFPDRRRRADQIDVERALGELPAGFREIVVLHDIGGYTHKEIAAMLSIKEGTSKSQLARGRARLREILTRGDTEGRDQRVTS